MICNAGFGFYGTVEKRRPTMMQRMMDVNFMGTFLRRPRVRCRSSGRRAAAIS